MEEEEKYPMLSLEKHPMAKMPETLTYFKSMYFK